MVNVLNNRTWIIDTVDADVVDDKHIFVKSVRWVTDATSAGGDALVIREPVTDVVLWETTASGTNYVEEVLLETTWPNGFEVPTLALGTVYITMR